MRLGFLGGGQIASQARGLLAGGPYEVSIFGRADAITAVDLLVETATPEAVAQRVPAVIAGGTDVLLLSVGALADARLRADLSAGPGRLIVCTGAVGGLDQIRALRRGGSLVATIESRKLPRTLIQPWMDEQLRARLDRGVEEIVLAEGLATEVAQRFPASANVAATLALAADAWETATARVIADPAAVLTRHTLSASGRLGSVTVTVENEPSTKRPRSSAVVAHAVARAVEDYARLRGFAGHGTVVL